MLAAHWCLPRLSAKLLSDLAWSAAILGYRPSQEWLLCFETQVCGVSWTFKF